ncbi:outer membrane beta-barrel protein [Mucilaginibacter frigoritolerans]|uniref:Outer membrane beta-barrel protein n=1 Tax=Mucilaginibacter frigoritolerans TaxID=652788 RepID=A0A562TMN1_9SPHI|nr:TonB-dependent receptor [Mucilaginibacter frigoritolerans]TWI94851.1 outer membrane beta-barrel protein [Mucilaginibacter frigoritolerans]
MKITIIVLPFLLLFTLNLRAQSIYNVKGIIVDTSSNAKLVNASISILNEKDSILYTFVRAGVSGIFAINNLSKGKFILLATYPGYADYIEYFSLDSAKRTHDFGNINMLLKTKLLADVIVKGNRASIKIKGDTTEFDARTYKVQPNATVEDLLKQLQGIQVDKDGKITAQGETVNKVLVDGEEFFGDDPTLVTKNLRADMVDKVQLYDKKSDQATFTGIDDGQKTKTINIKLKADKKNGYFGKVDAGYGTDNYYQSQILFNMFKAKQKFSFFSTISNDGKTGLGWEDNQKYGGGNNVSAMDDGSIMIMVGGGDDLDSWDGNYSGKGTPIAINDGVHYDSKWNGDKQSLNTNYKLGVLTVDGVDNTLSQNNLPTGGIINTTSNQNFHNYMFRNKLDATYQVKLDTTSNLKLAFDATTKHSQTKSDYMSTSRNSGDTLLNSSERNITNQVDARIFNANAFYTKKFKKKGRTFSWNVSEAYNESQANGTLKTDVDYFNNLGVQDSSQTTDQYKTNHLISSQLNSNMTYTEPLSKTLSIIFNYGLAIDNSTADRKSFNKDANGFYTILDSLYSNDYKLNQLANQGGAILNLKKGKTTINIGTKVSDVNFKQVNEYTGDIFKRNFVDWSPQASYQYRFSQQSNFNVNYNGKTTQPTVDQIQPLLVNTDPLNLIIGNPALKPSFTNNIRLAYNSYKVLSDEYLGVYGNYSFTSSPIVNSTVTDSVGKSTTQYINLNKIPFNYYLNIYYARKLSSTGINIGFTLNDQGSRTYNLSNGEINAITSTTYSGSLRVQKYVQKKYDFNISFGPSLTYGGSSLQRNLNNNGHGLNGDGGFTFFLPWQFSITSNGSYQYNSKTETFDQDYSRFLLNAWLVKAFDKNEDFKITLACNDILNQNSGFNRSSSGNLITQENYTTIKRFFMLTLVWTFNKMGGASAKN